MISFQSTFYSTQWFCCFSPATCVIEIQAGGKTTNIGERGQAKKLSLLKEDSLHLKANGL